MWGQGGGIAPRMQEQQIVAPHAGMMSMGAALGGLGPSPSPSMGMGGMGPSPSPSMGNMGNMGMGMGTHLSTPSSPPHTSSFSQNLSSTSSLQQPSLGPSPPFSNPTPPIYGGLPPTSTSNRQQANNQNTSGGSARPPSR